MTSLLVTLVYGPESAELRGSLPVLPATVLALSNSAKEGLVLSPYDCPAAHWAALVKGESLQGVWIDRTAFHDARKRGQDVSIEDFEEELELHFEPLPCRAHLEEKVWRGHVADLVRDIEEETLEMHRRNGTVPAGAGAVKRVHPHQRPDSENRSPKPMFHRRRSRCGRR